MLASWIGVSCLLYFTKHKSEQKRTCLLCLPTGFDGSFSISLRFFAVMCTSAPHSLIVSAVVSLMWPVAALAITSASRVSPFDYLLIVIQLPGCLAQSMT